ncbi:ubiquitin-protein ligase (E3) [Cryptotrichosporon argae]
MFNPDRAHVAQVNLSTASSASSSSLLESVRTERQARERLRKQERAAGLIQRVWRGRAEAGRVRRHALDRLEAAPADGRGLALVLKTAPGWEWERVTKVIERWLEAGKEKDGKGVPHMLSPLQTSQDYHVLLGLVAIGILQRIALRPRTVTAANLLGGLEVLFTPAAWPAGPAAEFIDVLAAHGWVETLVVILETLVAAAQPKKKHPLLQPVVRLLTAPLCLVPLEQGAPLAPPLLNALLTVPSLLSVIPIQSVTHLSQTLPLFSLLLPTAAADPAVFSHARLGTEQGKTYFLANLAVFGITGGLLARYGAAGAASWMAVVGTVFGALDEGWGRWAEGTVDDNDDDGDVVMGDTSDDDDAPAAPQPTQRRQHARPPLPSALAPKLALFASPAHITALSTICAAPSAGAGALGRLAAFVSNILHAFRGTAKWEAVLDATLNMKQALAKRLWREEVRGRWGASSSRETWDTFMDNPHRASLVLLTHIYNHFLLLTPDDEFFDAGTNPLAIDDVLDLARVWRDLAFWGYMHGVAGAPGTKQGTGTEEVRALFTRGVTRVAERNARRQFASDEFWVMADFADLQGFVQAAVFDDAELAAADAGTPNPDGPRWARARQLSKRQVAYLSPRLGLLNNLPMAVPFQTRLEVFSAFVNADKARLGLDTYIHRKRIRARIRRNNLAEDGFRQLDPAGPALKGQIKIAFIDQFGDEEAGIDGGGLFKEFLNSLTKEAFDANRGLWLVNDNNELYPNPGGYAVEGHSLAWYAFMGRVLGKAIYEGILVDVSFADFFLAKWLGRQSYLDDLNSLDKELYKGLIILKNYPNPEDLALNFTIVYEEFGQTKSVDLVPNGSEIAVTAENRHEYIQLVCKYKLDKQIAAQSRAFFNGLSDIIDPKWLRMFDQKEVAQLIGGEETPIDVRDMKKHTDITGFPDGTTPHMFWKVVKRFTEDEKRQLLRFITSCSRPPLLGFGHLNPKLAIRCSGSDTSRLPSASACFNLLKLPAYTDERVLRAKLLQAITSGAGFDLS